MFDFLLVFLVALLLSLGLTPLAIRLGRRLGFVAVPGGRRQHAGTVSSLGAVPLFLAFNAAALLAWQLAPPQGDDALRLRGVLLGGVLIFLGGLLDDHLELPPWAIFAIQMAGAAMAMGHIIFIELFTSPVSGQVVWIRPRLLALLFTLFWMLGMINTVNFLDGLDGLAAGVGTIAALLFAWHSYNLGQVSVALFPLALAGALLGLLPFNFAPARIFLGSGAYLLGFQLATLSILAPAKIATALLVMAVPILDIAWQIASRVRRGQSPFVGDRGHLHFRLVDAGISPRRIAISYYLVASAFGLVAIFAPGRAKLAALALLSALVLAVMAWSSHLEVARRRSGAAAGQPAGEER